MTWAAGRHQNHPIHHTRSPQMHPPICLSSRVCLFPSGKRVCVRLCVLCVSVKVSVGVERPALSTNSLLSSYVCRQTAQHTTLSAGWLNAVTQAGIQTDSQSGRQAGSINVMAAVRKLHHTHTQRWADASLPPSLPPSDLSIGHGGWGWVGVRQTNTQERDKTKLANE